MPVSTVRLDVHRRARFAVADMLMHAFIATGEKPSPEHIAFLREHVEEEQRYEAAVQRRLDHFVALATPGPLPVPTIRRVDAGPRFGVVLSHEGVPIAR
jgi:hypothetical protein